MEKYSKYYSSNNTIYTYEKGLLGMDSIYYFNDYRERIWQGFPVNKKQFIEIVRTHRKGIRK